MALAATLAMTAIGGAVSAYGQLKEGKAAAQAANYRAAVARNMSQYSIEQGAVEEQQQRMKNNALNAQQRAAISANGVEVNSGSAVDVQASGQILGELDAQTIRQNARARAASYMDQSVLDKAEGRNALLASRINAVGSLIGTATSVAGKWNTGKTAGMR